MPGSMLRDLLKNHIRRESKMDEMASNRVVCSDHTRSDLISGLLLLENKGPSYLRLFLRRVGWHSFRDRGSEPCVCLLVHTL